jgi:hypothetical protein
MSSATDRTEPAKILLITVELSLLNKTTEPAWREDVRIPRL